MANHYAVFLLIAALFVSFIPAVLSATHGVRVENKEPRFFASQEDGNEITLRYGGALRVGMWDFGILQTMARRSVFNGLVRLNETLQPINDLAKTWEISEDSLSYTFYLFDNVTWHDGSQFNSSDVKFTLEFLKGHPELGFAESNVFYDAVSKIDLVEIINSSALVVHLTQKYAPFLLSGAKAFIMPRHSVDPLHAYDFDDNQVGTGPFEFQEMTYGQNLTLSANRNYFRDGPYLDEIVFKRYSDTDLPGALENNEIDLIPFHSAPDRIDEIKSITGLDVSTLDPCGWHSLDFNFNRPPLDDVRVRRAISHAINRSEYVQEVFHGYAEPAFSSIPPILFYWHNPNVSRFDFNQTEAERLLDECGFPRESPSGWRNLSLTIKVHSEDTPRVSTTFVVEKALEAVGINVIVIVKSIPEIYAEVMVQHDFDLYIGGFQVPSDPDQYVLFHSEAGFYNWMSYNNSVVDNLIELGITTTDPTMRKPIYDELQEVISSDLPRLMLYRQKALTAYNVDFHSVIFFPSMYDSLCSYVAEKIYYEETLSGQGKSPVRVCFTDQEGRRTGFFNGSVVNEIPGSSYDEERNVVKVRSPPETKITVRNPGDRYRETTTIEPSWFSVEVVGTGTGHYRLELVNVALEYKSVVVVEGDTYEGKVDRYCLVVYTGGMIYRSYYPPYIQRTIAFGKQFIIPAEGVNPEAYDRKQCNTIIPR